MVYFVGAGPGDPDLITIKGRKLIEKADIIIYAGSLVSAEHLTFAKPNCKTYNSASMTLEEVIKVMEENRNALMGLSGNRWMSLISSGSTMRLSRA